MMQEPITDTVSAEDRQLIFEDLYEHVFPKVARIVSFLGGSFDDAKDIFQDALVIYYEKNINSQTNYIQTPEAYLIGIAKHIWMRKFKNDRHALSLDEWEQQIAIPEEYFEEQSDNRLLQLLERSGKKCLELLSAFYYEQLSLDAVSEKFRFSNVHSVSVQKYKCIDKIRSVIKEKFLRYEDFVE